MILVLRALAAMVAHAPRFVRGALAALVAWLVHGVLRIRRAHVEEAMARAGVSSSREVARDFYRALAERLVDLLVVAGGGKVHLPSLDVRSRTLLAEARARGPVLLCGSHTGNWELAACSLGAEVPLALVAKRQSVSAVDLFVRELRARHGIVQIAPDGAASRTVSALAGGQVVIMPIDQVPDRPRHGVLTPFLGPNVLVDRAPFVLAKRSAATALVVVCEGDRIEVLDSFRVADVSESAKRATRALERHVAAHPSSWLWLHRRWRLGPREGKKRSETTFVPPVSPRARSADSSDPELARNV